jgi:hypothetical protein
VIAAQRWLGRASDVCSAHIRISLATTIGAQMLLALVVALSIEHNRWLYYQGGDQIWLVTSAWTLRHLTIPYALTGWGWPLLLAPLTAVTGSTFVSLIPVALVIDVLVLAPIATLAVYDIGARVAGRAAGLWCAALWVVAPFVALPLFVDRYQGRWAEEFLPQALGFTQLADFPSMVIVLVAAALVVRSLDREAIREGLLAGALVGLAIGVKPANALFLAAPAIAYVLARRWRAGLVFAVALAPAIITLTVWKYRGLGSVPAFATAETHSYALSASWSPPLADTYFDRLHINLDDWERNMSNLREFFWSARLVQWAPLAGAIAVARRSVPVAAMLLAWLLSYVLVKGSSEVASIESGSFWRLVMPAFAAFLLLSAAIPLLVPTLTPRLGRRIDPQPVRRPGRALVIGVVVALCVVPLAVVLVSSPARGADRAVILNGILTPVDDSVVSLRTERRGQAQRLSWTDATSRARTFYRVYRTETAGPDTSCIRTGVDRCELNMILLGTTRRHTFVDRSPVHGATYRIGVGANWVDDSAQGDVFVLSPPIPAAT